MHRPSSQLLVETAVPPVRPLFITQQSLKPVSGPGVQTAAFAQGFKEWRHLHWGLDNPSAFVERSMRLQSPLLNLWPLASGAGSYKRALRRLGADWWTGARLKPGPARRLRRWLGEVDVIYAAPTTHVQASRMRTLIEAIDRPFVLHYWDMLDGGMQSAGLDTHHLLRQAHTVFALSDALVDELRPFCADCRKLSFVREPAAAVAKPPSYGPLNIALIGHVASYDAGLAELAVALEALARSGVETRLIYVGPARQLRDADPHIRAAAQRTGFLRTAEARDRALASCHVAFLSGPTASPQIDLRSRFSIPSRLLDFAATGLPIVATVHPASACAAFLSSWGPLAVRLCEGSDQVQAAILRLRDVDTWTCAHARLLSLFSELKTTAPERALWAELNAIARPAGTRPTKPVA